MLETDVSKVWVSNTISQKLFYILFSSGVGEWVGTFCCATLNAFLLSNVRTEKQT
ncbi:MAG: hypothetical protein AAGJ08_03780 [Cyanobacteria bacterium P01_H01_bin.35]